MSSGASSRRDRNFLSFVVIQTASFVIAVLVAVFVFCEGVAGACSMSLRQQVTPPPVDHEVRPTWERFPWA
jgi:hypothetical protein